MTAATAADLKSLPVLVSAALPQDAAADARGKLEELVEKLAGGVLDAGGLLVFGGHPSITPVVHRVARGVPEEKRSARLYQAEYFRGQTPAESGDTAVFPSVEWVGDGTSMDADIDALRSRMIPTAAAAIFLGGKTADYEGARPGVLDEHDRLLAKHPDGPTYLVGMLGGAARELIERWEATGRPEPNGLSADDRAVVRNGDDPDAVVRTILHDLQRHVSE